LEEIYHTSFSFFLRLLDSPASVVTGILGSSQHRRFKRLVLSLRVTSSGRWPGENLDTFFCIFINLLPWEHVDLRPAPEARYSCPFLTPSFVVLPDRPTRCSIFAFTAFLDDCSPRLFRLLRPLIHFRCADAHFLLSLFVSWNPKEPSGFFFLLRRLLQ